LSATLGTGCASTAWVCGLYMIHNWALTLFPETPQDEIWSKNDGLAISGSHAPAGTATAAAGGYRLTGRFRFSSGCPHAGWNLCAAMLPAGLGGGRMPAFVPAHRVLPFSGAMTGTAPGLAVHDNPIYRIPMLAWVPYAPALPAVGAARAAIDLILAAAGGRSMQADHPIPRAWRDIHSTAAHIGLNHDAVMSMIGQYRFGLQPHGQY